MADMVAELEAVLQNSDVLFGRTGLQDNNHLPSPAKGAKKFPQFRKARDEPSLKHARVAERLI
jgi:hypothetical protein